MPFLWLSRETIREFAAGVYVFQFDKHPNIMLIKKGKKGIFSSPIDTKMHIFPPIESFEA